MNTERTEKFVNAIACDLEEGGFRQVSGTTLRRTLATAVSAALPLLADTGIPASQTAELAEQQGVELPQLPEAFEAEFTSPGMSPVSVYSAEQMQEYARAALAATGKQKVGEVPGDALVTAEMVEAAENSRVAYRNAAAQYGSMSMDERHSRAMRAALETALAARQPSAQEPVAWKYRAPGKSFWRVTLDSRINHEWERIPLFAAPPELGIDLGQVREIRIPARNNLDPISVFVQDQAAGRGRIVVTCYGNAWQAFWGAMGDRTVMEFVAQCDADYVAGNMLQGRQTRIAKHEREYAARVAAEVIAEFRALAGQRDAAQGVG